MSNRPRLTRSVRCPENRARPVSLLTEKSISPYLIERIKSEMVVTTNNERGDRLFMAYSEAVYQSIISSDT